MDFDEALKSAYSGWREEALAQIEREKVTPCPIFEKIKLIDFPAHDIGTTATAKAIEGEMLDDLAKKRRRRNGLR